MSENSSGLEPFDAGEDGEDTFAFMEFWEALSESERENLSFDDAWECYQKKKEKHN